MYFIKSSVGGVRSYCRIASVFLHRDVLLGTVRGTSALHDSRDREKQELHAAKVFLHYWME